MVTIITKDIYVCGQVQFQFREIKLKKRLLYLMMFAR